MSPTRDAWARGGRARATRARGFTLLELLLVVGIAVALGALAMPVYLPLLARQEFAGTVDAVVAQCESARAAAQRRGMAIELVVAEGGTCIQARPVDLLADAEDDVQGQGIYHVDGMEGALAGSGKARALRAEMERRVRDIAPGVRRGSGADLEELTESWAILQLERGVVASLEEPVDGPTPHDGDAGAYAGEYADVFPDGGRIALFLPDGTAIASGGCWLTSETRVARLDVDPLLGRVTARPAQWRARGEQSEGTARRMTRDEAKDGR